MIRNNVPILEDEVVVEVVGQPGASKQELYFLALAAANGIVRRFQPLIQADPRVPPSMSMLMIEYDAADHWVRCTLRYQVGTMNTNVVVSTNPARKPAGAFMDSLAVYRGPQCEVVGGSMDFTSEFLSNVPTQAQAPKLPFAGQVILTQCPETKKPVPAPVVNNPPPSELITSVETIPSPNPKPPGDNRSRGAVVTKDSTTTLTAGSSSSSGGTTYPPGCCPKTLSLVQLVFAALTDPGSFAEETWAPPVQGPLGG